MGKESTSYILCSNPRSGTTLLCDMLAQTRLAGDPDSFFRAQSLDDWCTEWAVEGPVDPHNPDFSLRYFDAMRRAGRGETSVFGMRLMGADLKLAQDWLARLYPNHPSDAARLNAAFGPLRFIYLTRTDKLAEAVSYIRAEQTGLWHQRADGTELERIAPTRDEGYDEEAITERIQALVAHDAQWPAWFAREGIAPLHLTYQELADDPLNSLQRVLGHIGADPAAAEGIQPGVRKLADKVSAEWIARYRARHPGT